jgi:hypothetical protein
MAQTKQNTSKRPPKAADNRDQIARFKQAARDVGADTSPGALDRAFGKIEPKRHQSPKNPRL